MVAFIPVFNLLGATMSLFALAFLVPIGVALLYDEQAVALYAFSMAVTLGAGLVLHLGTRGVVRRARRELQPRDGFLLVSLTWLLLPLFAMLPFMLQLPQMSFTDAYF